MEIDNEELLKRTYALAKENNKLIKKMRRGAWFGFFFKVLIFVGVPIWGYFTFLQPIIDQIISVASNLPGVPNGVPGEINLLEVLKTIAYPYTLGSGAQN